MSSNERVMELLKRGVPLSLLLDLAAVRSLQVEETLEVPQLADLTGMHLLEMAV